MGRLAIQRILEGYGYELTGMDVIDAYNHFMAAGAEPRDRSQARADVLAIARNNLGRSAIFLCASARLRHSDTRHQPGNHDRATNMDKTKSDEALNHRPIAKRILAKMKLRGPPQIRALQERLHIGLVKAARPVPLLLKRLEARLHLSAREKTGPATPPGV